MTKILQLIKRINQKKVILFGTGSTSKQLYELLPIRVQYFVDNDLKKHKLNFEGLRIESPSVLLNENKDEIAIIIASQYHEEIAEQLKGMGFIENIHFWSGFQLLTESRQMEPSIIGQVAELKTMLDQCLFELKKQREIADVRYRDLMELMQFRPKYIPEQLVDIACTSSIAMQSNDHLYPLGTANDNTRWPAFVAKCETLFEDGLSYLDLGCSGGGLVFDFALRGHFAMGLEGSDYSLKRRRAEWRTIPGNLFTCDIAKPFTITAKKDQSVIKFHVITAWDVLEHLSVAELETLFANVNNHLASNGVFMGSISTIPEGNRHITVQNRSWWSEFFIKHGFADVSTQVPFSSSDFPRGNGNFNSLTDFSQRPDLGFHFILAKK